MSDFEAREFVVTGRVQGVSYRRFVRDEALSLGLTGWARNEFNGSVTVHAEGVRDAIDKLHLALLKGPSLSKVESVEEQQCDGESCQGFAIL